MTIKEKFSQYTIEELKNALLSIQKRIDKNKALMEYNINDATFYKMAKDDYERECKLYFDVECALNGRCKAVERKISYE